MSQENKQIVARWLKEFWGNPWNPNVVAELGTPDIVVHHNMHEPKRGRVEVTEFITDYRRAFPDLNFWAVADLIAEGDRVVARWKGGGTHTGPAFYDFRTGSIAAASGRRMRFSGTSIFRLENQRIAEELGQEDAVTGLQQLGLLRAPEVAFAAASANPAVPLGGFWQQLGPRQGGSLPHGWNRLPPRQDRV
jgi:predicted ester cyclase